MATVTIKNGIPLIVELPPVTYTLDLSEYEAVWLTGLLLRVNGEDPIYPSLSRALDEEGVDFGINKVSVQHFAADTEEED